MWKIKRRLVYLLINTVRYKNGVSGFKLRALAYSGIVNEMGKKVLIYPAVYIKVPECLSMGYSITIHEFCYFSCDGGVSIGNNVSIAHNCTILTTSHIYDSPDKNIRDSGVVYDRVIIGNNVWIGCGTRILAGSVIGDGVVIGANSVVKGILPSDTVCVGMPAKPKKKRFE